MSGVIGCELRVLGFGTGGRWWAWLKGKVGGWIKDLNGAHFLHPSF